MRISKIVIRKAFRNVFTWLPLKKASFAMILFGQRYFRKDSRIRSIVKLHGYKISILKMRLYYFNSYFKDKEGKVQRIKNLPHGHLLLIFWDSAKTLLLQRGLLRFHFWSMFSPQCSIALIISCSSNYSCQYLFSVFIPH